MPLRPALFRVSALAAALALGLSPCSTADTTKNNDAPPASSSTEQGTANPQLEKYYSQGLDCEKRGSTIE